MERNEIIKGCRPVPKKYSITAGLGQVGRFWPNGHNGTDFGCPRLTKIQAFEDGYAEQIWEDHPQMGRCLRLRHKFGYTLYAHLEGIIVKLGDKIKRGEEIAVSGNSGTGSGPHLHFGAKTIIDYKNIPVEFEDA